MNADTCIPHNYTGYGNNECFTNCPIACGLDEIHCSANINPDTGIWLKSKGLLLWKWL